MRNIIRKMIVLIHFFIIAIMISNAQSAGKYADVNGLHMYYEIHGSGKPLVLIHGGGSTITTSFGMVLPLFAKTHQVIALELQAHGHTADNGRVTTFEQDADDVAELLKQLKIKGADILGFSNGGSTALQIAIRHPELVQKIIAASAIYKREGLIPGFFEGMNKATLANMPQVLQDAYKKVAPRPQDLQIMFERDAKRMINFKDWKDDDIRSINAPTLIIASDKDVVLVEHAVQMYRLLPHGSLSIFPGLHGEYIGALETAKEGSKVPQLFVAQVNEFLDSPQAK